MRVFLTLTFKIVITTILGLVLLVPFAKAQTIPPHLPSSIASTQPQPTFLSFTNLFNRVYNSIVEITLTNNSSGNQSNLGTGYIYDNNGHIVTAEDVIRGSSNVFDVTFADGNIYTANVIGKDRYSNLAVLQLDKSALSQERIQPLIQSNSSTLQIGQQVAVIGNPFGLSFSLTSGMISGLHRLVPVHGFSIPNEIQFNGIVNPGDSGPVLSLDGQVIGLTNQLFTGNNGTFTGINFAVPSNTIRQIVPQLILHGTYKHAWLGISGMDLTPDISKAVGINQTTGVIVGSVAPSSPAAFAGITNGTKAHSVLGGRVNSDADIIVSIDGHSLAHINDLISYIDLHKSVGDKVVLTMIRHGHIINLNLLLQARPGR